MTKRFDRKLQQIDTAIRRKFVLDCRRMGATYRQIAEATIEEFGIENLPRGWSERLANQDVSRELERLRNENGESIADLKAIDAARLEEMHSRVYPVALGTDTIPPDLFAIDRVLKIMAQRSKLFGLDAPTEINFGKMTDDQLLAYVAAAIGPATAAGNRGDGEAEAEPDESERAADNPAGP